MGFTARLVGSGHRDRHLFRVPVRPTRKESIVTISILKSLAASAVLTLSLLGASAVAPAMAANDVDLICWEYNLGDGSTELECMTPAALKAECALTDPGNASDECKGVNSDRPTRPVAQSLVGSGGGDGGSSTPSKRR
jgi:hypothetical protein